MAKTHVANAFGDEGDPAPVGVVRVSGPAIAGSASAKSASRLEIDFDSGGAICEYAAFSPMEVVASFDIF